MGVKVRERNGSWWIYIDHKGRRKAVKVGTEKAATAAAPKIEEGLTTGKLNLNDLNGKTTFGDYAGKWIEQHVEMTCKPGTIDTTRRVLKNHVLPSFENFLLHDINRESLRSYCAKRKAEGYSTATIAVHLSCISGVLDLAVEDSIITANPCVRVRKYAKGGKKKRPVDFLTPEEGTSFLTAAREHTPRFYPLFLTALRTGMRIGELVALQWGDVDFNGKFIVVQRTFWQGTIGTPKNGKTRHVDMSDQLVTELSDHRRRMASEALREGREMPEWIFSTVEGKRLWPQIARGILDRLTKKAGIRKLTPHIFRHSFASQLIAGNQSLVYIQKQLGHSSISMTVDVYGHLVPGANREAVNLLDDQQAATPAQPRPARAHGIRVIP